MTKHNQTLDILIIGAGQAGLAMGYHLKQTPSRFQLEEALKREPLCAFFCSHCFSVLIGEEEVSYD